MTTVADPLKQLAAQAALALQGHLTFLQSQGVEGLPPTQLARKKINGPAAMAAVLAGPAMPKPAAAPAAATPRAEVATSPAAAPKGPGGREVMPWERHLPGNASRPAAASAPPPPAPQRVTPAPAPPPPAPQRVTPVVAQPAPSPPVAQGPPVAAAPPPAASVPSLVPMVPRDPNAPVGARGLTVIREDLGDCKRCKLHSGRTNIVYGVGSPTAEICFVGEGPGADEDLQGEPFVGRAGQLLTQMIKAMGLEREDVYICNVVKCRPPNNRDPEPDEVTACSPFLIRQVRAVGPKVIVTLGKHAAHTVLNVKTPITRLRGTWGAFDGIPVMPTFHPSFLLRDPTQKKFAWEDLKAVLHHLGREVPAPRKS